VLFADQDFREHIKMQDLVVLRPSSDKPRGSTGTHKTNSDSGPKK